MSDSSTLASVLESQTSLLQEASLALPHQFSQCTYSLGPIRQAVYLCLTCTPPASSSSSTTEPTLSPRGICSACSIACHTDHEQLELFPKRDFRCDCPTHGLAHACTLHTKEEAVNGANVYGRNFAAAFCRCGRKYDAEKEKETMIQCVECEDWFHESCLNLRERPPSREPTPAPPAQEEGQEADADDGASDASSSGLPPPLIRAADHDALMCSACVRKIPAVRRVAGSPGVLMVVRSSAGEPWRIIGQPKAADAPVEVVAEDQKVAVAGEKRERSTSVTEAVGPDTKRARVSEKEDDEEVSVCLAPTMDRGVQKLLERLDTAASGGDLEEDDGYLGAGDVFFTEGWRDRWCTCVECSESIVSRPHLIFEEDTYEPPEDPDSGLSLEELGMRALQRLPRERAIDGIMAFNAMRDDLMKHLRPFAERGEEVTEEAIRGFFDARVQDIQAKRKQ